MTVGEMEGRRGFGLRWIHQATRFKTKMLALATLDKAQGVSREQKQSPMVRDPDKSLVVMYTSSVRGVDVSGMS